MPTKKKTIPQCKACACAMVEHSASGGDVKYRCSRCRCSEVVKDARKNDTNTRCMRTTARRAACTTTTAK
ncbi:MAG TPA: hypothetical protein DCR55_05755 [Lentisphaeria bacterium]|nr:hypothetical protein [Lentisphaeria bacterium]